MVGCETPVWFWTLLLPVSGIFMYLIVELFIETRDRVKNSAEIARKTLCNNDI